MQVSCKTLKPAYWFLISIRPHGDVMRVVPHINSRGVRMNYLQAWALDCNRRAHSFLSFLFRHSFLLAVMPDLLHGKLVIGFGPVTMG
jgi:hypothetical protein